MNSLKLTLVLKDSVWPPPPSTRQRRLPDAPKPLCCGHGPAWHEALQETTKRKSRQTPRRSVRVPVEKVLVLCTTLQLPHQNEQVDGCKLLAVQLGFLTSCPGAGLKQPLMKTSPCNAPQEHAPMHHGAGVLASPGLHLL